MIPDQLTTKVRLVRCPRCRNLLPELPNFQVYKCGGCGVTLQAKNRSNGMRMSSSLNETVASQKIGLNHVSEDKRSSCTSPNAAPLESGGGNNERHESKSLEGNECRTSNDKPTFPGSEKCFSDQNNEKDEEKSSEDRESCCSTTTKGTLSDSGECFSSQNSEKNQDEAFENKESSSSSPPSATFPDSGEFFSEQNNGKSEDKSPKDKVSGSSSRNASISDSRECSSGQKNELQNKSSEGNDFSSSTSPKATFPVPGECFSGQNIETQTKCSQGNDSSSSSPKATFPIPGECFSGQNNETQSKSSEGSDFRSSNPKATFPNSGEFLLEQNNGKSEDKSPKDKVSGSSSRSASISDSRECSSGHNNEIQNKSSEGNDFSSSTSPKATFPVLGECFSGQNIETQTKSSEGNDSSSSSPKATFPVSAECFSGQNNETRSKSSEGNDFRSSSPKATFPDSGECFSDQRNERNQIRSSEGNESSSSRPMATFPDSGHCFLDHKKEESQNKSPEDKEFGSKSPKATFPDSGECTSNQTNGRDPDKSSEVCQGEQLGDLNSSCEEQNNRSVINHSRDVDGEPLVVPNDICSSTEFADNETEPSLLIMGTRSGISIHDEGSPLAKSNVNADMNKAVNSDFKSSSAVNPGATIRSSSIVPAYIPARKSTSSDTLASSPDEQLKEPQNSVPNGFNHRRVPDTFETKEFNPSSEFSDALREMSKSPAQRSHHAYDGSVSSYDGMDDHFSNWDMRSNFVHSQGRPRRDKFLVNRIMDTDSGLQHKAMDSWSSFSEKNDKAMKYRKRDQAELLQPSRQGHPMYQSRMAFHRRAPHGGYQNGGPRSQLHNEYQSKPGYQSSVKSADTQHEKMTLLRMVYELQDQVNNLNEKANGRIAGGATWEDKSTPLYSNYEPSEEELFHDPNYQRYLRSRTAGRHYPPRDRRFMRVPFSSEATTSRHQAEPSYLHRGPQDWQCSAPLPIRCSNNGLCRVHPGQNCWTSYDKSSPSSPERYAESDYSVWGRETMPDDLRHRRHDAKKYARDQHYLVRRHFLPIAGGAPIISCYNCLKLLQIPADFLLFKRRFHRLRCGGCSEVLKFSLQKRSHIVPYEDCAIDPPPSEVGDYGAANFASTSQQDPVSCSDDYGYGLAYRERYSTEGDPGILAPSNSLRGSSDINMIERKEFLMKQYQNKDKNPVETFVSARPSLSEIEELPQKSSSPLHRLMGYASPSQVIRGAGSSHTGTSSYTMPR